MGERGTLERLSAGASGISRRRSLPEVSSSSRMRAYTTAGIRSRQRSTAVRQRRRSGDRDQRPARLHGRDGESSHTRLGRRRSLGVAVLGNSGAGYRGARGVARRPRIDQFPPLLGGGDEATRSTRSRSRRALPVLAGGHPERLPGIEELAVLAEDAVIVSTADPFHHGIGYGIPQSAHWLRVTAASSSPARRSRTGLRYSAAATTPATTRTASRRRATRATQVSSFATSAASCAARSST